MSYENNQGSAIKNENNQGSAIKKVIEVLYKVLRLRECLNDSFKGFKTWGV